MRATRHTVLYGAIGLLSACFSAGAQTETGRVITVDGQAEIRVIPDQVVLSVGVETFDSDLATAKADNDERVTALLAATESMGIARKDVRTDFLSIQPQYKGRGVRGNFLPYLVRKNVVITLNDISKFEVLLSSLLEAGVNYVHGADFRTTESLEHLEQARELAIKAAKTKAEAIAEQLGQKLGKPKSINVSDSQWRSSYGHWGQRRDRRPAHTTIDADASGRQLEGPTAPGQISIMVRVSVTYELME